MPLPTSVTTKTAVTFSTDGAVYNKTQDGFFYETNLLLPNTGSIMVLSNRSTVQQQATISARRVEQSDNTSIRPNQCDIRLTISNRPGATFTAAEMKTHFIQFLSFVHANYEAIMEGNM